MRNDLGAGGAGLCSGIVFRAVVDDGDGVSSPDEIRHHASDHRRFIVGSDDHPNRFAAIG
jgi:hypothetical protein